MGGDFNAVINPALDKSQSDTTANPSSKSGVIKLDPGGPVSCRV